ncbi:MAG: glycosyltransferase family 2 protein [Bacteroidetes bacterium]|nr:glycosyltransferase family 2 protein [Bacteroidota bacterium]MBU1719676.1 glycosyltransferase family 2 protein [Bacteroidota bacterium]
MKRIAVVIPAYNEEASVSAVVSSVNSLVSEKYIYTPIVVNDASTDRTAEIASKLDCILLSLPANLGIGGAVQTGFRYAWREGFDYAFQVDGDGQHPADQLPVLLKGIENTGADVVIGSRFITGKGFQSTFLRRTGIRFLGFQIRIFTGQRITDCTSGFRVVNRNALELINEYYPDEYPEPESILYYHRNKLTISEIPVVMHERTGGKSSIRAFSTIYYIIKVSLAMFFTNFRIKKRRS